MFSTIKSVLFEILFIYELYVKRLESYIGQYLIKQQLFPNSNGLDMIQCILLLTCYW